MSCYSPLKGWTIGLNDNGKRKMLVTSYNVDHIEFLPDGRFFQSMEVFDPVKDSGRDCITYFDEIPCGSCTGCRLERSKQWANRCLLEMQYHESSYFLTITYDDDHLPHGTGVLPDTGEIIDTHSLRLEDLQKFFKRLRKAYDELYPGEKLRYFACGEYGDKTARPHYHAIVFGLKLTDLEPYKRCGDYWYYNSSFLSDLWPFGYVVVGEANRETAGYVARYCTKKLYGDDGMVYESLSLKPPFIVMSRKPGIASQYLVDHPEAVKQPFLYESTVKGGIKFRPPKYFQRKFDEFFEDDVDYVNMRYEQKEEAKRQMKTVRDLLSSQTDQSYLDMLASQEAVLKSKLKKLERSL